LLACFRRCRPRGRSAGARRPRDGATIFRHCPPPEACNLSRYRRIAAGPTALKPGGRPTTALLRAVAATGLEESTFPDTCPFTLDDVLAAEFWPDPAA